MSGCGAGFPAFLLIVLFGVVPAVAWGGQTAGQGTPYFTNKDLEKYGNPPDKPAAVTAAKSPKAADKARETAEEREKEYWCRKASSANKRLEKRQDTIDEIEREIAEMKEKGLVGRKTEKSLHKRLAKAKREHGYAEKSLGEIADEAHRKGIPPGWLRCQFE
jgi:hypothetical protein